MWVEKLANEKFKYFERYTDPYTEKSRKVSVTLEKDSPQAHKQAQTLLSEKIDKLSTTNKTSSMTFSELYDEWYKYYQTKVKRTSWIKVPKMMVHIDKIIKPNILISRIDSKLINQIIDEMYTFGNYSLNYTKQTRTTLSNLMAYAVYREYLPINPVEKTRVVPKMIEEEKRRHKMSDKYLERDEARQLINHLYMNSRYFLPARVAEFLWLTGLRYGELMALEWQEFDGKSIRVNGTLDYTNTQMAKAVKTTTKNFSSTRVVDLPKRAVEILKELKTANAIKFDGTTPNNYIFLSNNGTPYTLHAFNAILKKSKSDLNFKKHLTSHIFRHSHVSLLAEMNIPLKTIMERVGHSDANTTLSIYNHVTKKSRADLIAALDNII